eukprot:332926-Chlamydomonas_euryale.AAC.1
MRYTLMRHPSAPGACSCASSRMPSFLAAAGAAAVAAAGAHPPPPLDMRCAALARLSPSPKLPRPAGHPCSGPPNAAATPTGAPVLATPQPALARQGSGAAWYADAAVASDRVSP